MKKIYLLPIFLIVLVAILGARYLYVYEWRESKLLKNEKVFDWKDGRTTRVAVFDNGYCVRFDQLPEGTKFPWVEINLNVPLWSKANANELYKECEEETAKQLIHYLSSD